MNLRQIVPQPIIEHYQRHETEGTFQAVTMFIDLSGFSTLSDELIQYGREGTEVLTDIINQTFDPIIQRVYEHTGFISTFAGDAFTAIFPLKTPESVAHAVAAAFEIQALMAAQRHLYTRLGTFSLAVKIGLDVGAVYWGILGQGNLRTYYYRGPAIDGAAHAEALAKAGHIIASAQLWPHLTDHVQATPVENAYRLTGHTFTPMSQPPHLPSLTEEHLRPFVPPSILHLHISAEFRNVCSTFVSFQEPPTADALNNFVTTVMNLADIYGGYFNKIDFGDKGNVILLLFGAPISYENNVERAAEFLLALRKQERHILWRAGVTFGTAYTGIVGGRFRCEYTAIGDVVNLSSRLMSMAQWGHILTDARVHRQIRETHQLVALGRRSVKGKRKPILVYRLTARKAPTAILPERRPLFGRERELSLLREWLEPLWQSNAESRTSPLIHIIGEAGIGKTRLLQELRSQLEETHALQWLYCPADEILRQSLNPFVHALKQYFHQSADQSAEENRAAFQRILTDLLQRLPHEEPGDSVRAELERTASMLAALIDIYWADSLYEQLEPQLRFENTLQALINFFKALTLLHPLILEVDGGHLLDRDSITLLQRITRELKEWPVAVIVTSRPTDTRTLPGTEHGMWRELPLGPLDQENVRAIATTLLGKELTPEAVRFLYEKSSGNPFFVEQLVQYLREQGAFLPADDPPDAFTLAAPDTLDIPSTIDAVLISRLDRLSPPVRDVVQTASVLGKEFEIPVLAYMVSDADHLPSLIRAAETAGIWRPAGETRYAFTQALLRDVAYHMQMRERLRTLHRRAGEAYETIHKDDLAPYYADLAYHYEQGEDIPKAVEYLRKAGDQARLNYQNEAALSFYERLLAYAGEDDRVYIHEYRGDIYHSMGSYAQALEAYASALEIWLRRKDQEHRVADIYRKIASIHVDKGEYNVALDWLDRALLRLRDKICPERARVLLLAAGIAYRQGRVEQALEQCRTALDIAQRLDALPEQAHGYRLLGTIHTGAGNLQAAVQDYLTSLELCRRLRDLRQESMTSNSLAAVYYYQGELDKAEAMYLQSLEVATRIGFVDQQATVSNNLGELYLLQGRFTDAETQFQRCLRTWQRTGFLLGVALSWRNLAQIAVYRGHWKTALQHLQESLRILEQLDSRDWVLAEVYRLLAEVKLAQGDEQAAWDHARQALAIVTEQNIKLVESNVQRTLGMLYRHSHQFEEAEKALQKSAHVAQTLGLRYEEGKAWAELARLYKEWGREKEAQEAQQRARDIFLTLGANWEIKQLHQPEKAAS